MLSQGAIPDDDDDDTDNQQQVAGNIPQRPAGPGGDQPNPNPFPIKNPAIPFGKRADAGAIPEGAADDDQTASLSDALQTVDDVMQFGYQQHGLSGGDQQAAIPTQPAGPGGDQPNPNPFPIKNPAIPFGKRADAGDDSDSQALASGGPVSGQLPPVQDDHALQMNQLFTSAAQRAQQSVKNKNTGTGYADGGAIEDGGAIPDPSQGGPDQEQQPSLMSRVGSTIQNLPQPMPGGAQGEQAIRGGISRIVGLVQGMGAMPPQQAQQLEAQSGEKDPNVAKIKTAAALAQQGGPSAAWSYLQSLRKQFDVARTAAAVKAGMGALPQSTQAANIAMQNVLDGTSTTFTPDANGNGVTMTVNKLSRGKPAPSKGYADGGAINTDDTEVPDSDITPSQDQSPESSVGNQIGTYKLSIPQYYQILMGKEGQFDHLYNTGPAAAATAVTKGPGMQPRGQQGSQSFDAQTGPLQPTGFNLKGVAPGTMGEGLSGGTSDASGVGVSVPNSSEPTPNPAPPQPAGSPAAASQSPPPQGNYPAPTASQLSPARSQQPATPALPGQTAPSRNGGVKVYSGNYGTNQDNGNASNFNAGDGSGAVPGTLVDNNAQLVKAFGADAVRAAQLAHPNDHGAQMAQLVGERNEQLKAKYQQENTNLLVGGRNQVAETRGQYYLDANTVKAQASTQNGRMRLQGQLANASRLLGQSFNANLGKVAAAQLSSGQPLSPDLQNWLARTINQSMRGQNEGGQTNNDQTAPQQAAPTKNFSNAPGLGGQTRIQQAKDGQYYKVNADGVVVEGPVPAPTQ